MIILKFGGKHYVQGVALLFFFFFGFSGKFEERKGNLRYLKKTYKMESSKITYKVLKKF